MVQQVARDLGQGHALVLVVLPAERLIGLAVLADEDIFRYARRAPLGGPVLFGWHMRAEHYGHRCQFLDRGGGVERTHGEAPLGVRGRGLRLDVSGDDWRRQEAGGIQKVREATVTGADLDNLAAHAVRAELGGAACQVGCEGLR